MTDYDVIIVGGGAAGLMCAIEAGRRGRKTVVLEGSNKPGKKILMSGGGRCNFTNLNCTPDAFLSENPHFCKSALNRYTPEDFVSLVNAYDISFHEKTLGQLFCDDSSKDIVRLLTTECRQANVEVITNAEISDVAHDEKYKVTCRRGELACTSLVIASGGLSIPKMGASNFGYRIAEQFGLNVIETKAGLVPFTFTGVIHEMTDRLSGISVEACVSCNGKSFTEKILFTHRGLSGPAALQISSYWTPGDDISIDLFPDLDLQAFLLAAKKEQSKSTLRSVLSEKLPRALIIELQAMFWSDVADRPMAEITDNLLMKVASDLQDWRLKPAATEGYRTAEVTLGGVDTAGLSSKTMEAKCQPGLYFIGEVVDVTGHLGGYNFQWAWASAVAAGEVV